MWNMVPAKVPAITAQGDGFVMLSDQAIKWSGKNIALNVAKGYSFWG